MPRAIAMRPARSSDAARLSEIAFLSKAHWGYPAEFMEACRDELAVPADFFHRADITMVVLEQDGSAIGFYVLVQEKKALFDLDAMFVDPDHIGSGAGRRLFEHAIAAVRDQGGGKLEVQSDPNAVGFYQAMGATTVGEQPSGSIPGRMLPVLALDVASR